jgi:probable phosphoglycerate mutase
VRSVTIRCDGGASPNPGPAGAGAEIVDDSTGEVIAELSEPLGIATNNQAEYRALLIALERALELGAQAVTVYADSELVVRQVLGLYAVKDAALKPLHDRAKQMLERFARRSVHHVPREQNQRADALATAAIARSRQA